MVQRIALSNKYFLLLPMTYSMILQEFPVFNSYVVFSSKVALYALAIIFPSSYVNDGEFSLKPSLTNVSPYSLKVISYSMYVPLLL